MSDLAKYSVTRIIARSVSNSWASCSKYYAKKQKGRVFETQCTNRKHCVLPIHGFCFVPLKYTDGDSNEAFVRQQYFLRELVFQEECAAYYLKSGQGILKMYFVFFWIVDCKIIRDLITLRLDWSRFCRAMLCKRGLCRHAVSVCMSVRLSRSWIPSKRHWHFFLLRTNVAPISIK